MWNESIILIKREAVQDGMGNYMMQEVARTEIMCNSKSIKSVEFYRAAQGELRPSIAFEIHAFEYSGEELLEYSGKKYKVLRTYKTGETLELTCETQRGDASD